MGLADRDVPGLLRTVDFFLPCAIAFASELVHCSTYRFVCIPLRRFWNLPGEKEKRVYESKSWSMDAFPFMLYGWTGRTSRVVGGLDRAQPWRLKRRPLRPNP